MAHSKAHHDIKEVAKIFFSISEFVSCVIKWRRLAISLKLFGVDEALFLS